MSSHPALISNHFGTEPSRKSEGLSLLVTSAYNNNPLIRDSPALKRVAEPLLRLRLQGPGLLVPVSVPGTKLRLAEHLLMPLSGVSQVSVRWTSVGLGTIGLGKGKEEVRKTGPQELEKIYWPV